jgi:hypothetical protein
MRRSSQLDSHLFADGDVFQTEVLGRCKAPFKGHMQWREAAEQVRKHQPAKKTQIVEALEREFEQNGLPVVFYTAVGSALDYFHGVDGYFEFRGVVVTIDVTINSEKTSAKADLVVHPDDLKNIRVLAARIGREFVTKMQRR